MILVLSQRDIRHPRAGGAEKYLHHALRKLAQKHKVIHISVAHPDIKQNEVIDGICYKTIGRNLITVIWHGYWYYQKNKRDISLVIDHANTHQFFTFLWARKKRIFFTHQLTQEIWHYFYGRAFGTLFRFGEEILLRLSKGRAITVSYSTAQDLRKRRFQQVEICPEGNTPVYKNLPKHKKEDYLVYAGRLAPYKGVEDAIYLASKVNKRLYIVGRGADRYSKKLIEYSKKIKSDCEFLGFVSREQKDKLIEKAYLLIMPSVREGWGLVITESANLGTPALVYNAPGVIEAVNGGQAGFVSKDFSREGLVRAYKNITPSNYEEVRQAAFDFSLQLSWENTSSEFLKIIENYLFKRKSLR